ncbi:MAG: 3-deoxy-D-manno-octulosonic acid transferase [Exilispira sp.]
MKDKKNEPFYIVIATSAGEIATIETLFESLKYNLLIFTTSITGRDKNKTLDNSTIFYMPVPLFLYSFFIINFLKPDSIIFLEHELWPSHFFASYLLNIPVIVLQIRPSLFKSKLSSFFYINLLKLSRLIILTEDKAKYPSSFPFELVAFYNIDIKTLKSEIKFLKTYKFSIIFASTHAKEEDIFFKAIKIIDNNISTIYFIAPRHPDRYKDVIKTAQDNKITAILYSDYKDQINEFFKNLDNIFIESNFNYSNIKQKFYQKLNLKIMPAELIVIIVNTFGILDMLYKYSKVAIVGGSFAELGGGHNIYEPLLNCCNVIVGPFFYNMQSILDDSIKLKIALKSDKNPDDLSKKIIESYQIFDNNLTENNYKKAKISFSGSPYEKLYNFRVEIKQHILDKILKVSGNS